MQRAKRLNRKGVVIGVWVLICVIASFALGVGNPSKQDSEHRLTGMNADMDYALHEGGNVDSRDSNAKFGGAFLYVNISGESWSHELASKYRQALLGHGWIDYKIDKGRFLLCKKNVLATINLIPDVDKSRGIPREVYGFSMKYGGGASRACR